MTRALVLSLALLLGGATAWSQAAPLVLGRAESLVPSPTMAVGDWFVAELARRSGVAFDIKVLPNARALAAANSGEIDGNIGRTLDVIAQYPNLMPVPTRTGALTLAMYGASPDIATKSRAEIARLRVGVIRGSASALKYSRGMHVSEAANVDSAFEMLANGRIDVLLLQYVNAEAYRQTHPDRRVQLWPHAWAQEPLYLVLNRKHAALVPRLDAAVQGLVRDGTIRRNYVEALTARGISELPDDRPASSPAMPRDVQSR